MLKINNRTPISDFYSEKLIPGVHESIKSGIKVENSFLKNLNQLYLLHKITE
jgi:hypothetical protein